MRRDAPCRESPVREQALDDRVVQVTHDALLVFEQRKLMEVPAAVLALEDDSCLGGEMPDHINITQ